jgi:hypothetical protein
MSAILQQRTNCCSAANVRFVPIATFGSHVLELVEVTKGVTAPDNKSP